MKQECSKDADCASGKVCVERRCVDKASQPECKTDADCKTYYKCQDGKCAVKYPCKSDTDCLKDEDKVFDITEKTSACSVYLDYNEMMAVPQASLVYVNASNNEVQVRSCEPSEEIAPVPLVSVTDGCSIRHDFAAGRSYQTGRHI